MKDIFVFGSNLAGIHGAGAARTAFKEFGAMYGVGFGLEGNTFAIPTKDREIETLPIKNVARYISLFLHYSWFSPHTFYVTRIGCGLAGFEDKDIAPFFRGAKKNCIFDIAWESYLDGNGLDFFEGDVREYIKPLDKERGLV